MLTIALTRRVGGMAMCRRNMSLLYPEGKIMAARSNTKFRYIDPAVGAENPTYLKEGQVDMVVKGVAVLGLTVGLGCIFKGLYNMANGVNKL